MTKYEWYENMTPDAECYVKKKKNKKIIITIIDRCNK